MRINLYEKERCRISHLNSGTIINTDGPIEWGGKGRSLFPTDLVSAALGSCILSVLEPVFDRSEYDSRKVEITIKKKLSQNPLSIKSLTINISYPDKIKDSFKRKVKKVIETCPVKKSLSSDLNILIKLTDNM